MYVDRSSAEKLIVDSSKDLMAKVEGRFEELAAFLEDSDWALVIKLHAVLEAVVTEVVVAHSAAELKAVVTRLPLSDSQIGKAKMGVDLGVIEPKMHSFIRRLSELRNEFVHNPDMLGVELKAYVDDMNQNQRKRWKTVMVWSEHDPEKRQSLEAAMLSNPRTTLFISALSLILSLDLGAHQPRVEKQLKALEAETTRQLLAELKT
ncbi:hypothetical protein ACWKWZ_13990 [Metapseudomonas otitidis]